MAQDSPGLGFFTVDGDRLVPEPYASSLWGEDQMHGVAAGGAMARAAEATLAGRSDLTPVRFTVDLFRPVRMQPCELRTRIVREGRRLGLVDVELVQDGEVMARAATLFLAPSEPAEGRVWAPPSAGQAFDPPPEDLAPPSDEPHPPYFASDGHWSAEFADHQNAGRKSSWNPAMPIVVGERATPFQAAASVADGASLVTNWGEGGIEHINTDLSLILTRAPESTEIGLVALDRATHAGIASGVAAMFDRVGRCGTVNVTSLVNSRRTVDLGSVAYSEDGTRTV
jgi:hypothetical protein